MDASSGVWGAVIALIGLVGMLATGKRGPRELPPGGPPEPTPDKQQLQVSPQIWGSLNTRIGELEHKVDRLTEVVEAAMEREKTLIRLLRVAVAALRRANKRLKQANQPEEPVPSELLPYGAE